MSGEIADVVARERARLLRFIRRRVPDPLDAEDVLQDVFQRLVEANRLLMPIDHVTAWLFRVARNRITDLFRSRAPKAEDIDTVADLLPSPDAGPDALFARGAAIDTIAEALAELPREQREVFVAHEIDGRSFKEIARDTGVNLNTLLSRKRYAVRQLRARLQPLFDDLEE